MEHDLVNALLPESGSTNANDCGYDVYPECKAPIENVMNVCDTCSSLLECERCIWYFLPSALNKESEWDSCCPCLYYKASVAEPAGSLDWLKVHC